LNAAEVIADLHPNAAAPRSMNLTQLGQNIEPHLAAGRTPCLAGSRRSASINGMVYVRGHPLDFERWEE
jgi:choline dehydrogenase-like flavoprotein